MRKRFNRIITALTTVAMMFGSYGPQPVYAGSDDVPNNDVVKENSDEWYTDYEYSLEDGKIYLNMASENLSGAIVVPAKASIEGEEYAVVIDYDTNGHKSLWDSSKDNITSITLEDGVEVPTDCSYLFYECNALQSIDLGHLDTSNVFGMNYMFAGCANLTNLDVSGLDTSSAVKMYGMFEGCSNLATLDVSHFDTSNVYDMCSMFSDCSKLTSLDVSHFDTSNVEYMRLMFNNCSSLKSLDVSNFNTSKVTQMYNMFYNCSSLTSLDVSNFDTSKVTSMYHMFRECSGLTSIDLRNFC